MPVVDEVNATNQSNAVRETRFMRGAFYFQQGDSRLELIPQDMLALDASCREMLEILVVDKPDRANLARAFLTYKKQRNAKEPKPTAREMLSVMSQTYDFDMGVQIMNYAHHCSPLDDRRYLDVRIGCDWEEFQERLLNCAGEVSQAFVTSKVASAIELPKEMAVESSVMYKNQDDTEQNIYETRVSVIAKEIQRRAMNPSKFREEKSGRELDGIKPGANDGFAPAPLSKKSIDAAKKKKVAAAAKAKAKAETGPATCPALGRTEKQKAAPLRRPLMPIGLNSWPQQKSTRRQWPHHSRMRTCVTSAIVSKHTSMVGRSVR